MFGKLNNFSCVLVIIFVWTISPGDDRFFNEIIRESIFFNGKIHGDGLNFGNEPSIEFMIFSFTMPTTPVMKMAIYTAFYMDVEDFLIGHIVDSVL